MRVIPILFLSILGITTIATAIVLALFIRRRNVQPLKFRAPWLVFCSGVGLYAMIAWLALYLISKDSPDTYFPVDDICDSFQWVAWIIYPLVVVPYALRSYRTIRIFNVDADNFIINPRYWNKLVIYESTLLKGVLFACLLSIIVKIIIHFSSLNLETSGYGCSGSHTMFWLALNLLEIFACIYVVFKLRRIRDDYGMSCELTAVGGIWFFTTVAIFVSLIFKDGSLPNSWFHGSTMTDQEFIDVQAAFVAGRNFLVMCISLVWPLCQTYYTTYVPLWSYQSSMRALDTMLRDIVCVKYFRDFLHKESNVEYILAWVEIELYKDLCSIESLRSYAYTLFDKYIDDSSELSAELNLTPAIKERIAHEIKFGTPTPNLFDHIQDELYDLMNAEFPRFLKSEQCRECMQELEKEQHLKIVLERSDMITNTTQ